MTITIYSCSDSPNTLNKTLTSAGTITVTKVNNVDSKNPNLVVPYSTTVSNNNYLQWNGLFYYYHTRIISNTLVELICECDVLMSFKTQINSCSGIVQRSQNSYNVYYPDSDICSLSQDLNYSRT